VVLVRSCRGGGAQLSPSATSGELAPGEARPVHNFPVTGARFRAGWRTAWGSAPSAGSAGAYPARDPEDAARKPGQAPGLDFGVEGGQAWAPSSFDSSDPAL